ncbi:MAG: hypothetical protein HKN18_12900 [Silicimonas sp.]|nr:hypothetical protein [Silicimonas sp.]
MELTIHIGPHKTGTTAIQTAFARAAPALRKEGLLYPKTNWHHPAQHRLAFALKNRAIPGADKPDIDTETDELLYALDRFRGDRVLLSSEEFFACPPEALSRLKDRLGVNTRVVTFLRRPDNFLISCYNQKIKQPGNGFHAPIRRFLKDPYSLTPEFDFPTHVTTWAEVFGKSAICLEVYENGPPLARLRALLGQGHMPPGPPARLNASVPGVVADLMRHAKVIGMSPAHQRALLQRAGQLFADCPPFVVADADRIAVIAALEPELDALFKSFNKTNPYTRQTFQPVPAPRDHNANMQDLMRLVDTLL